MVLIEIESGTEENYPTVHNTIVKINGKEYREQKNIEYVLKDGKLEFFMMDDLPDPIGKLGSEPHEEYVNNRDAQNLERRLKWSAFINVIFGIIIAWMWIKGGA